MIRSAILVSVLALAATWPARAALNVDPTTNVWVYHGDGIDFNAWAENTVWQRAGFLRSDGGRYGMQAVAVPDIPKDSIVDNSTKPPKVIALPVTVNVAGANTTVGWRRTLGTESFAVFDLNKVNLSEVWPKVTSKLTIVTEGDPDGGMLIVDGEKWYAGFKPNPLNAGQVNVGTGVPMQAVYELAARPGNNIAVVVFAISSAVTPGGKVRSVLDSLKDVPGVDKANSWGCTEDVVLSFDPVPTPDKGTPAEAIKWAEAELRKSYTTPIEKGESLINNWLFTHKAADMFDKLNATLGSFDVSGKGTVKVKWTVTYHGLTGTPNPAPKRSFTSGLSESFDAPFALDAQGIEVTQLDLAGEVPLIHLQLPSGQVGDIPEYLHLANIGELPDVPPRGLLPVSGIYLLEAYEPRGSLRGTISLACSLDTQPDTARVCQFSGGSWHELDTHFDTTITAAVADFTTGPLSLAEPVVFAAFAYAPP